MTPSSQTIARFRTRIWRYYRAHARSLPWRETRDPYAIVVSEVMLQQTQVSRVLPYYQRFLQRFPAWEYLARSSLKEVLQAWQGLGYNRRARALREMALIVTEQYAGRLPANEQALLALPGIGRYSAAAIRVFAFSQPAILIETNIRSALIQHFFPARQARISDQDLHALLDRLQPKQRSRLRPWYYALMDYGAFLKTQGVRLNQRSAHYRASGAFKGSAREIRGGIVRLLSERPAMHETALLRALARFDAARVQHELRRLTQEGMLCQQGTKFRIEA